MKPNVPMIETGSVIAVMTVLRHECRNKNTINIAKNAPSKIVLRTSLTLERMLTVWSWRVEILMSAGRLFCNCAICVRTLSATSKVFVPLDLMMVIESVGCPSVMAALFFSAMPSSTCATCSKYTG